MCRGRRRCCGGCWKGAALSSHHPQLRTATRCGGVFVVAVEVGLGGLTVGVDVETCGTGCAWPTRSERQTALQVRETTAWAEDLPSEAAYGVHEEI